jgi:hypothetical protein
VVSGTDVILRAHLDMNGQDLAIEHWQDCEDIIERNKQLRSMPQRSDWGRHIASIPNVILLRWMEEDGANVLAMSGEEFGAFIKKKLADPDWAHLRVDR